MCGTADSDGQVLSGSDFQAGCASELDEEDSAAKEAQGEAQVEALGDPSPLDDEGRSGFDPRRALCADGACVGVLGEDRRCKVCGQLAER
jgi:hypothetical protein